jgi:tetratricopeptide (TPR) repeat protein
MLRRAAVFLIAIASLLPVRASGQAKTPTPANVATEKAEAKLYFDRGTVHFNLDEWSQAIEMFKAAYRVFPDPNLLYNIAQCYRKMGKPAEALKFYKNYLRERPDAPNRAEVGKRIDEMQAILAVRPPEPPLAAPMNPSDQDPSTDTPTSLASNGAPSKTTPPSTDQDAKIADAAKPVESKPTATPAGVDVSKSNLDGKEGASSKSIVKTWWFWTAVGTVAAAGTIATIRSLSSSSESHYQGSLEPHVQPVP